MFCLIVCLAASLLYTGALFSSPLALVTIECDVFCLIVDLAASLLYTGALFSSPLALVTIECDVFCLCVVGNTISFEKI